MLRRLALSLLVAVLALGGAAAPALASGSGDLFPRVGAADAPCDATHPCRAALEWRTNAYGPAGDTQIRRRTLFTVFARAGERILTGSSSMGTGTADIAIWNPGQITDTEAATLPAVVDGTNGFSCAAHRPDATSLVGKLSTRAQELAGARSADGTQNTAGYVPCVYTAPTTGLYRVAFYGAAGSGNAADGTPDRHLDPVGGFLAAAGSAINAWDLTVRDAAPASVDDIPGRALTYVLAGFTGGNPRPVSMRLFLNTLDGYRYAVDTRGFDPNGFVFYGNREGFLDADGTTPLNHDVVGTGSGPQMLPALDGGVHLAAPQYPLSFEPLATETLTALGIPATPVPPTLSAVDFTGLATDHGSYVGQGGTFALEAGSGGTYEIVISRDGVSFDPGLPGNRALRGLVPAGTFTVTWDGNDNTGVALPVKTGYAVRAVLRAGEYHAPMLDVESSTQGGPSITLLNPPNGRCPFTGAQSDGTNCTRVFFDDRTYVTSAGTRVGDLTSGTLCPAFSGTVPAQLFADPDGGVDSTGTARAFGDGAGLNANQHCPATGGTLGDAKGLDLWTYFPSLRTATSLDVLPVPAVPVAADDAGTTPIDTPLVVPAAGVLTNDAGTRLTVLSSTTPTHGLVTTNPDGSFTYTPALGYTGSDQFDYTVTDDYGQTDVATVHLTVTPLAVDDTWTTTVNTPVTVGAPGVLGNDLGMVLTAGTPSLPTHGTVALDPSGALVYTPDLDFSGTDTFTYVATDGPLSDQATVTIVVTPAATDDDLGTVPPNVTSTGTAPGILANDTGSVLTVTAVGTPAHGTVTVDPDGSWAYTPPAGWGGTDTFTYTATDAAGQTVGATVTVHVTPPVQLASASDDHATGAPGTPTTLLELTNDAPGDHLAWALPSVRLLDPVGGLPVSSVTVPGEGVWTVVSGQVRFTPVPGFQGDADLGYQVTNTRGQTVTAAMTVSYPAPLSAVVAPPILPVVSAPVTPTLATPARPTTLTVTVRLPGDPSRSAGLATTGADPAAAVLLASCLVGAGVVVMRARRRVAARG
ncbi:tandem-95 repeat protein [Cellulomonas humilata]|uniref:Tandem-95 repeat protein n=1 Tax=Cellulomonas humilata TaxID=144055 RepID=A0A7Y5ZYP6_9CELL|nr:Ig-like domain-containing protein [Cellulomonas humilata]NUU16586.1 tandem-95 repeat protein [Cellulomonas humilata]